MSYIEREAVLADIQEEFHKTDVNGAEQLGVLKCHRIVRTAPTADVVEVRHGHWEVCSTFDDFLKCSICASEKYPMAQVINHKYCPDCGATVDEFEKAE